MVVSAAAAAAHGREFWELTGLKIGKENHIVAFVFTNTFSVKSHFMGFQMVYQQ